MTTAKTTTLVAITVRMRIRKKKTTCITIFPDITTTTRQRVVNTKVRLATG